MTEAGTTPQIKRVQWDGKSTGLLEVVNEMLAESGETVRIAAAEYSDKSLRLALVWVKENV